MPLPALRWYDIGRERIVAFDPGLTNLLLAARAASSVMLALLLLYVLTQWLGLASELLLIGAAMAMFSVLIINDSTRRQQVVTALLLPLPAMLSMSAGALLSPWRFADDGLFIVIIFSAVYVRRFGPRAFAMGMLAFVAYFIGTLLTPAVKTLPWLFCAICAGVVSSLVMRHVILPERPRRALKRMLQAVLALTGRILDDVLATLASGNVNTLHHRVLRRRLERLNEAAISTESQLEKVLPDGDQPNPSRTRLALAVLDLELRAERVVVTALESTDPQARQRAMRALRVLREAMRERALATVQESETVCQLQHSALERAVHNLAAALATLSAARVNSLLGYFSWQLLLLRLEETAIGVTAGVVVSILLLPMSVRSRANVDSRKFLILLAEIVAGCGERLVGNRSGGQLTVKARALDRQFQQLRTTVLPLTAGIGTIAGAFSRQGARRWVRSMLACRYYAASLARTTQQVSTAQLEWPSTDSLAGTIKHVSDNIRMLAGLDGASGDTAMESAANRIEALLDALPEADADADANAEADTEANLQCREILDLLGRIDRIVVVLARDFG